MIFPEGFPDHAQSAVIAAQVRATQWIRRELNERMPPPGYSKTQQLASVGRKYVLRIFAVFAKEACELGKQRVWTTRRIDLAALEFLRDLAVEVRSEYSHLGMPDMVGQLGVILPDVLHEMKSSPEWKTYQEQLVAVADLQTQPRAMNVERHPDPIEQAFMDIKSAPFRAAAQARYEEALEAQRESRIKSTPQQPTSAPDSVSGSDSRNTVGDQIRRLREECRWTLPELAEEVNLDERTISRHESGESKPYARNISKYERVFSKRLSRKVLIDNLPSRRR